MIPLNLQLENRYRDLKEIRQFLLNLDSETLTYQMTEHLSIDFHHLDVKTGATSGLVTPYFLPRASFPSCRDMSGDLKDSILEEGQNRADYGEESRPPILQRFFPAALLFTYQSYASRMSEDLDRRIFNSNTPQHGWVRDRAFKEQKSGEHGHFFTRRFRYTTDISVYEEEFKSHGNEVTHTGLNPGIDSEIVEKKKRVPSIDIPSPQTSSHSITDVMIPDCHEGLPSISEVVAVVDEILDAMRAQRNELRTMTHKQSLTIFHHILPRMVRLWDPYGHCRLLYAYFDGNRLKVQFTEVLDFEQFAVDPPPEIDYLDIIDLSQYYDMIDRMLKWAWPVVQGDTSKGELENVRR